MQTQNQIENFLFQRKFDKARECLNNGETFNDQYLKKQFFSNICQNYRNPIARICNPCPQQ
ncbi:Ankyrin [Flavobacterium anhuiense]|uniref:Ankyrin n=1 Tax=Flavobacterium anhuiense TaxID=459526 RepID=A0A444VWT5_9FLAO|nr:Ankyrin [Flavobacterium anhuiense]